MDIAVNAIVGALILLALGWLKTDISKLIDRVDRMDERISSAVSGLSDRVARIEGRLDEREHH